MRPVVLVLPALLLGLSFAVAATPEEGYLAARDAAIAKIKKLEEKKGAETAVGKEQTKALAALDKQLQPIVGGLAIKAYPAKGAISFDTLSKNEVGFGVLDGLRFASADGGPQAVVTTDGLMTKWLSKPAEWWTKTRKTPPSIDEALATDGFYTFAIGPDAAFTKMASLPIKAPDGAAFATATLGGWSQDVGPNPEQEIIVALRKGDKIYIASERAKKYKDIPACEAIWKEAQTKAEATYKKYADGGAKDQKAFDAYNAINDKADKTYRACYAERTPKEAFFPAVVKEAQEIADRFK